MLLFLDTLAIKTLVCHGYQSVVVYVSGRRELLEKTKLIATILKFKMAAIAKWVNVVIIVLVGFLAPENFGIDTKIRFVCISKAEI